MKKSFALLAIVGQKWCKQSHGTTGFEVFSKKKKIIFNQLKNKWYKKVAQRKRNANKILLNNRSHPGDLAK